MRETRNLAIRDKVFSKQDVLNLANTVFGEFKSDAPEGSGRRHSGTAFIVRCSDDTSYESDSLELFTEGAQLDLKKTSSIEMRYFSNDPDRRINISFGQGRATPRDYLDVSGEDANWVNGTFTRLVECIKAVRPRDSWVISHKTLVLNLAAVGIGAVFINVFDIIFDMFFTVPPIGADNSLYPIALAIRQLRSASPLGGLAVDLFFYWLAGIAAAFWARDWLLGLWPDIEFDFGPEHVKYEKARRGRVYAFFSIVVIPIALRIAYDVARAILSR